MNLLVEFRRLCSKRFLFDQVVMEATCTAKGSSERITGSLKSRAVRTRASETAAPPLRSARGLTQPIMNSLVPRPEGN